jgi:hypothetical protein
VQLEGAILVATVAALLFLVGCNVDQTSPTPPATVPDVIAAPSMAYSAARFTPLDPGRAWASSAGTDVRPVT